MLKTCLAQIGGEKGCGVNKYVIQGRLGSYGVQRVEEEDKLTTALKSGSRKVTRIAGREGDAVPLSSPRRKIKSSPNELVGSIVLLTGKNPNTMKGGSVRWQKKQKKWNRRRVLSETNRNGALSGGDRHQSKRTKKNSDQLRTGGGIIRAKPGMFQKPWDSRAQPLSCLPERNPEVSLHKKKQN